MPSFSPHPDGSARRRGLGRPRFRPERLDAYPRWPAGEPGHALNRWQVDGIGQSWLATITPAWCAGSADRAAWADSAGINVGIDGGRIGGVGMQPGLRSQCSHILAGLQRRADGCWPLPSLMLVPTVVWTRHRPRRLSEHAAAVADREAVELLWGVADGVELRARPRRRGLGLAWQMCDDGVAPARLIPRPVRVLGGPSAGAASSAIRCRPACYCPWLVSNRRSWTDHGDILNELGSRSGPAGASRDVVDHQGEADAHHPGVLGQGDALLGGTKRALLSHAGGP